MLNLLLSKDGAILLFIGFLMGVFMYVNTLLDDAYNKTDELKNKVIVEQVKTNNLKTKLIEANNTTTNKVFEAKQIQKKKDLQDATKQYDDKDINSSSGLHWLTI